MSNEKKVSLPDFIDLLTALKVLARNSTFVSWFDKSFVKANRFPTGTPVDLIYRFYCNENSKVSREAFDRRLSAAFELVEHRGWAIAGGLVKVGPAPLFPIAWYMDLYDRAVGLSVGKMRTVLSILL